MLHLTIKITVAIAFEHKALSQCYYSCWASVADSDLTLSRQRDMSMCVLGTLNTIPFDKRIYSYVKVQKLSGDF